jgi:plastocyanin
MSNCNNGEFGLNKTRETRSLLSNDREVQIRIIGFATCIFLIAIISSYILASPFGMVWATVANSQDLANTSAISTPNIDAKHIFDTKTAVLGNDIKNLIILIPDEAHHGNGEAKENRFIEQSFLPQNAVVNRGTNVIWFSGDVSHEHRIIFNNDENLFDSGVLSEFTASNPMVFNTSGDFGYYSPDIDQEAVQKGFVMRGDVKVIDQPNKLNTNPNSNVESVGVFMVPTNDLDDYSKDFTEKGFSIESTYSFKDLRGIARDTGSEQTLIVWTAGSSMTTDMIISALEDIGSNLPYK